jgi:hypothetical protein
MCEIEFWARRPDSSATKLRRSPRSFVAGLATLDYGCAVLIDRNDLPKHLFGIPDLDLSEDLSAEPLGGSWFRLGACSTARAGNGDLVLKRSRS